MLELRARDVILNAEALLKREFGDILQDDYITDALLWIAVIKGNRNNKSAS